LVAAVQRRNLNHWHDDDYHHHHDESLNTLHNYDGKKTTFWDTVSCSLVEVDWRFWGAYCLRHQGDHPSSPRKLSSSNSRSETTNLALERLAAVNKLVVCRFCWLHTVKLFTFRCSSLNIVAWQSINNEQSCP
jgi:hypothetical protein